MRFDTAIDDAHPALDVARRDRDVIAERASRARFRAARDARDELANADRFIASARGALADAEHLAKLARSERSTARAGLEALEREDRDSAVLEDYRRDPTLTVGLERELGLLDRWCDWANGAPMTAGQIGSLHQQLERGLRHDWLREDPTANLVETLKAWAIERDVALPASAATPSFGGPEIYLAPEL